MEEDRDSDISMVIFLHAWGKRKKEQHPEHDLRVWTKGKGGGRKEPRFINGDVPRCMRNKEETQKSDQRMKEERSSSKTRKAGSSKEEEMNAATKEDKDPADSSKRRK